MIKLCGFTRAAVCEDREEEAECKQPTQAGLKRRERGKKRREEKNNLPSVHIVCKEGVDVVNSNVQCKPHWCAVFLPLIVRSLPCAWCVYVRVRI